METRIAVVIFILAAAWKGASALPISDHQASRRHLTAGPTASPPGFDYDRDAPLTFTISAKNTTADFQRHSRGMDTSAQDCTITGAKPRSRDPSSFEKGPLNVSIVVGQRSVITLKALPNTLYKQAVVSGASNVTSVDTPMNPQTITFAPDYSKEQSRVSIGVFGGSESAASCTLTIYFHAKKANGQDTAIQG